MYIVIRPAIQYTILSSLFNNITVTVICARFSVIIFQRILSKKHVIAYSDLLPNILLVGDQSWSGYIKSAKWIYHFTTDR